MNRSFRCQTCDKRRTSLNVSLYTSRLTGLGQDRKLIEKVHVFNLHQMYVHANSATLYGRIQRYMRRLGILVFLF